MSNTRPNLLFVFPDQMRGQAMGFLAEEPVKTPVIDRFANESCVLTHAAATYPVCSPYRAMLMTGMYPHSNRVIGNCTSRTAPFNCELQTSDTCWSDILSRNGYDLGYIGKWHLDSPREPYIDCLNNEGDLKWNDWCRPDRRHGFDYWYSYGTYDEHTRPMYWDTDAEREDYHYVDEWGPVHEADKAIAYIKNEEGVLRHTDRPFALVVSMNPPHMPYDLVPQEYADRYADSDIEQWCERPNVPPKGSEWGDYYRANIRNYYAMITGVDEQFGRILDALDQEDLKRDTIVVFTSDHGNCLGIHDKISKSNPYEESMRIPFIIRWPEKISPGKDDLLLSAPDVYPTLMELMGFSEEVPPEVEGTAYGSLFLDPEESHHRPSSQLYTRITVSSPDYGIRGIRTHQYTLAITVEENLPHEVTLFDNLRDPYQLADISNGSSELVTGLIQNELVAQLTLAKDPWIRHIDSVLEKIAHL